MHPTDTTLQIYHRHFKLPPKTYFNTVANFPDPWDERTYQFVVHRYLTETRDGGILGMARKEKDENHVYLGAAVRYPVKTKG